jgi:outer membrane protein
MKRWNHFSVVLAVAAPLLGLATGFALAADEHRAPAATDLAPAAQSWFAHLGFMAAPYDEKSTITVDGVTDPTADIGLAPSYTLSTEAGYFLTPNIALAISSGYPPTESAEGAGSISGLGTLGKVTGGMTDFNVQYHFTNFGAFQPYVGAGPTYFAVFDTQDGAMTDFKVRPSWGANLQIGADWMLTKNLGVFADVKKVFISTTSTGSLGGVPVNTDVQLNPTLFSVGLTLRY